MTTSRSGAVVIGPAEPLHAALRILSVGGGVAAAAGWIESTGAEFSLIAGWELSEADRVVSADPLSPAETLLAALSVWAGELSRGDRTVLSPAGV